MTVLERNIIEALAALRAARHNGDTTLARHCESRLNWLIDRLPARAAR